MTIAARVEQALRDSGAPYKLVAHRPSDSTHSSAQTAHVREHQIAKAVVIRDNNGPAMAVIPGDTWLDVEALSRETGRRFELDTEADLDRLLPDCVPGAVPPLGTAYAMETFLDESLRRLPAVYFEGGDHTHLVMVNQDSFGDLMRGARQGRFGC